MPEVLDKDSLRALSAGTRQAIVKLLRNRPYTASEISRITGKHVTTVSEHLETLRRSGIIEKNDTGNKWLYYKLTSKGEKLFKPQYYSWVVALALSVVGIFFGLSQMFWAQDASGHALIGTNGMESKTSEAAPVNGTTTTIIQVQTHAADDYAVPVMTVLLVIVGCYAAFRIACARKTALAIRI